MGFFFYVGQFWSSQVDPCGCLCNGSKWAFFNVSVLAESGLVVYV